MEFLAHFGLDRLPFTREATNFDYYQGAKSARTLLDIQGRLAQGETRIAVTGTGGMGKSMLAYRLAEILSPELFAVCVLRESVVNLPGHVEAMISAVYGSIDADQIAGRKQRGIQPVVLIDAADRLHAQSEAMLDELAMAGVALVRFAREGAGDLTLEAWDEGALARMLLHRIRAAGAHRPLFDKESILSIVRRAAGNPGVATALSNEALWCAWHCGLESVNSSIADTLCQGDLDADALGSSVANRVAAVSTVIEVARATTMQPVPVPEAEGSPAPILDESTEDLLVETSDEDAILGELPNSESIADAGNTSRAFLDQSQFMLDSAVSNDVPAEELLGDDLTIDIAAEGPASGEGDWGADLSADLSLELETEVASSAQPGNADDFDLSQLDALVTNESSIDGSDGGAVDDLALGGQGLDDELAAFEALASAPGSGTAGPSKVAVPDPIAASTDDDLDGMFASLENDAVDEDVPQKVAKPDVTQAPSADPMDDIDAMLGSWESQEDAAAPAKPMPTKSAPQKSTASTNIEDELDDLLAKFDS